MSHTPADSPPTPRRGARRRGRAHRVERLLGVGRRALLGTLAASLVLAGATATPGAARDGASPDALDGTRAATPAATAADSRFGVVVTGPTPNVAAALQTLGAAHWYYFDEGGPTPGQAALVRPGQSLADMERRARAAPGEVWLIGNEPNVPGQDDQAPEAFADFLAQVAAAVRGADPTAILVGPGVLNWDKTCSGCPGYTQGRAWSEAFVASYQQRYGPLPLNAWGMHTYSLDWDRLPLVDAAADQAQLAAARAWLDAQGLDLPLWLTEFGVIWGFDGVRWEQQPDGAYVAQPVGELRADLMAGYLDQMFRWLTGPGVAARVDRWYLYGTSPPAEPWASTMAGIGLLQDHSLTPTGFGERYRAWASGTATTAAGARSGAHGLVAAGSDAAGHPR